MESESDFSTKLKDWEILEKDERERKREKSGKLRKTKR